MIIENPVINSAFEEPARHFKFTDDGITDEIVEQRRISGYFLPIPAARKKSAGQLSFQTDWTQDRFEESKDINRIRERVNLWRRGGYPGVARTTAELLRYWTRGERERRLFFCQIEAAETAIYLAEAAKKYGDTWIENLLREKNDEFNPGLLRIALKMATGSGKTVVMAMLIAWQALNKFANPQDGRFSDTFLVVTPGITIRDRLGVLRPNDLENYYEKFDLLPPDRLVELRKAKIAVTNFHAFLRRERGDAAKLTKTILRQNETGAFTETPDQMVRRVCRDLGQRKNIVVINDEAHHCYRPRPADDEDLRGDERREAEQRQEEARVWISGLQAIQQKVGIKVIYDLSATPFFLRGSGYGEGTLFPWVVSDFSLVDAIESGIVKVPRVPVSDDSMAGELPTYRDIWRRIRDDLPRKGRGATAATGEPPKLPAELQGALHSLYGNYEKTYRRWEAHKKEHQDRGGTPPVFIVVCNNTNVSKLVFDYVAGWEKPLPKGPSGFAARVRGGPGGGEARSAEQPPGAKGGTVVVPGALDIFSNEENGGWTARPNTILVDSAQLESGEGMSADFKKMAAAAIERFKVEYRARFPGRDAENLTDEDLLREVMNTVGKPGKLGEHVKCVVSVSMLTEGWDATTVTHILGVRAFGTQLLCEQVVGRGLRRMSFALNPEGRFDPEYAEVYGVPFSFIPCSGSTSEPRPGPQPTRVRALEDRIACEITFPRLIGYRYEVTGERLDAKFTPDSRMELSTRDVPTKTENAPIVGERVIHDLDDLRRHRPQEVAFRLAKVVLEKYFAEAALQPDGTTKRIERAWLFPSLLRIARRWLDECVKLKDNTFPQLLLLHQPAYTAADKIYKAIVEADPGTKVLRPILRPYDVVGSTRFVAFDTTRPVWATTPSKCHISHVVADTESWEQKMAQALEDMPEVVCYVKNQNVGFVIPYVLDGEEHAYYPDFVARIRGADGAELNLIVEVTGQKKKDKDAKVSTARSLWAPAVNNHGGFGRWAFVEIRDPWNAATEIREELGRIGTVDGRRPSRDAGESRPS